MRRVLSIAAIVTALCLVGVVLAVRGASPRVLAGMLGAGEPQWGADIGITTNPSPTPGASKNPSVAIDPTNENRALAAFTTSDIDGGISGYGWSTDSGSTWTSDRFIGPWSGGSESMTPFGDSHVAFDGAGVGYYSSFAIGNNTNGYFVLTTTNGADWSTPMPVALSDFSTYRSQSSFAVDPRVSGPNARSLYMAWIQTASSNPYVRGVWLQYSRDGGRTWSQEIQVSDPGHEYSYAPSVAVASDGTVYVAFEEVDNYFIGNAPKLYLARSTDGGTTWSADILITGAPITSIGRPDYKYRELTLIGGEATCNLMRIGHFPVLAVSPTNPDTVYVAWNDGRWESPTDMCGVNGRHSDIAFTATTDAGHTWLPTVRVNDDPTGTAIDHFQPAIAVKPDGLVGLTWYDRRYSTDGYHYDAAYSQTTNGGLTWSPNRRVSDLSSDPDALPDFKGIDDVGWRRAIAFGKDYALTAWLDTREGFRVGEIYSDHGSFLLSTATPTASPTGSSTATITRTPTGTFSSTVTPTQVPSSTRTRTRTPTSTASATVSASTSTSTSTSTLTPTVPTGSTGTSTPTGTAVSSPTTCPMAFRDVQTTDWFYDYVNCLYCRGAISGYNDGTFRPYNYVTRAQLCKMVVLAFDMPIDTNGGPHFSDVPPSNPFYDYIETAYNAGIVAGYVDVVGNFRWANNVTRGQLSKIVTLAAGWPLIDPPTATFSDVPVGSVFFQYIETAYCHGIIDGYNDGTFRWQNDATRGQIAKIVCLAVRNETACNIAPPTVTATATPTFTPTP